MKIFFKISIILLFCIILSSCFAQESDFIVQKKGQLYPWLDMIAFSNKEKDKITDRYNKICDNLVKNFSEDKEFIQALRKNQKLFLEYRKSERDVVLPRADVNLNYGFSWEVHSDVTLIESTENQIKNLRKLIEDYCLYNYYEQDENACKPETIDRIFK